MKITCRERKFIAGRWRGTFVFMFNGVDQLSTEWEKRPTHLNQAELSAYIAARDAFMKEEIMPTFRNIALGEKIVTGAVEH